MRDFGWLNGFAEDEDVHGTRLKPARPEPKRTLSIEAPLLTREGYFASNRRARSDAPGDLMDRDTADSMDTILGSQPSDD